MMVSLSAPQHLVTPLYEIASRHAEPACTATHWDQHISEISILFKPAYLLTVSKIIDPKTRKSMRNQGFQGHLLCLLWTLHCIDLAGFQGQPFTQHYGTKKTIITHQHTRLL